MSTVSSPRPVRVVTVTPNPSLDRTVHVPSWVRGEVHRVRPADVEPSGKGVNVAVALHGAGCATVAVLPVGGPTGRELTTMLDDLTLPYLAVPISGAVRINTSIVEADGTTTKFNEPGPTLTDEDVAALTAATAGQAHRGDWIAWCGSLPAGFRVAALATAIATARAQGRLVALDTSEAALAHVLSQPRDALPHLVKPNAAELAELVGRPLPTVQHVVDAACVLVERGVDTVLVSLGGDGAVLADAKGVLHGRAPVAQVANTAGAGDAFLAGYLAAVTAERRERLASALCFGAGAVQQSGTLLRRPDASVRADVAPWTSSRGIAQSS